MKQLIILLIPLLIAGCNPCKRLTKKCPPTTRYDSVYIEKVKLDTITLISPADTLYFQMPVEFNLNDLLVSAANKPGPKVDIKIKDRVMEVMVVCPEDSLKAVIHSLQTELKEKITITPPIPKPERYTSKFAKFTIIFFFCCVFIGIVAIVYYIKVGTLRTALNRFQNPLGK